MKLASQIISGDYLALSKGITLLESTLEKDKRKSLKLISICREKKTNSIRIGISGSPGVGKSTFIEKVGKIITESGKKVAVLAIDPSSAKTKGSILGDKSRMSKLASNKNAFIRPSSNNCNLGGVSYSTRESIILCEAAGYEVIIIETVGVGQSETSVRQLVDFFLLLILPGSGDELQGIKRGIVELADAIYINKADGKNLENAEISCLDYKSALELYGTRDIFLKTKIGTCSAINGENISEIYNYIQFFWKKINSGKYLKNLRNKQDIYWLHNNIKVIHGLKKYDNLKYSGKIHKLEKELKNKDLTTLIYNI